ncbi:MAG TPA: ATP-binding protein [Pyrinomonadaceae bacterium]|nr:ATP-binding protein [Pyrinomonadaceae bacterium]
MTDEPTEQATDEPGGQKPRRRGAPWLLGGLVLSLLFVLIALQVFGLWEVFTPDTAADTLLLYALSSLNFVAFIIFAFIFVRNLLKLRRERRAHELGSKIKTRLVVYFITVSLLPITVMALFSYLFLNRSLEKWFGRLPEDVQRVAREARREDTDEQVRHLLEQLALVAKQVERDAIQNGGTTQTPAPAPNAATIQNPAVVESTGLSLAEWSASEGGHFAALQLIGADGAVIAQTVAPQFAQRAGELEAELSRIRQAQGGNGAFNNKFTTAKVTLADGRHLLAARPSRVKMSLERIVAGSETFEQLRREQRKVRSLGLSTIGLMTLLLLFAATWSAIHLARGIGAPIRALAEAADEVARGNLAHRVATIADDELAILAASFNQMTAQLAENRRRIEAGAGELRDKNLALDERRNYIETVLESLSTGVISLDEENRVTTINAAAVLMLRLGEAPEAGAPLKDMLSMEDHLVLERVLARARRTGRAAWQMELARGASADGGVLPVALTATALGTYTEGGAGGHSSRGIVLVIEDLTELLSAQRAAAWSEVARRMAHEIKNPLTPIQLSAERIARNFRRLHGAGEGTVETAVSNGGACSATGGAVNAGGEGGAEPARAEQARVARVVEECTTTITREVAGLKAMVDEFSRFARLPHARLEAADLNEVVRQAVTLYEDRLEDVRLNVHLARTLPPGLLDTEQMRRAIVNLIDNALEAMTDTDGERRITVATGHDPSRGMLLVEIADTGHGIERSDFSRLFQPYFSTRGRGTGLGLAIVQRIVNEHGGRIRAEPNRPRGAKFLVEIPVTDEPQKTNEERGTMNDEKTVSSAFLVPPSSFS